MNKADRKTDQPLRLQGYGGVVVYTHKAKLGTELINSFSPTTQPTHINVDALRACNKQ